MANEIVVSSSLSITKGYLYYPSSQQSQVITMNGTKGPSPGSILVSVAGTDIDMSQIGDPGLCYIKNLDATNAIEAGVWNPDQSEFYPVMKFKAGEGFVFRMAPLISEEYGGTGTGTTGQQNTFRIKAQNAACQVLVDIFDD